MTTVYEADWGRYQFMYIDKAGNHVLRSLDRAGACVIVAPDKLAREYREVVGRVVEPASLKDAPLVQFQRPAPPPKGVTAKPAKNERGKKTKAAAAAGMADLFAKPVAPDAAPLPLETLAPPPPWIPPTIGDVSQPARPWTDPPKTLGAIVPGGSLVSWPGHLIQFWMPCATPADGGGGAPHAWFVFDNLDPTIYCDDCRERKRTTRTVPEVASIPADHPRAQTWTLWSWDRSLGVSRDADERSSSADVALPVSGAAEAVPPSREPPLSPTPPAGGKPPWAGDFDGKPLWQRVGGRRGAHLYEVFAERSAIHEHLGHLSREYADYLAYHWLLQQAAQHAIG